MRNATLIYNPTAGRHTGRRERLVQQSAAALRAAKIEVTLARTTEEGAARELAKAAVEEGSDLILVCGGDGTINEVINGIVPGRATVGILPAGTANIVARELGLPRDPVRAARELPRWSPRRVAVGQVTWQANGPLSSAKLDSAARRYFLSVAGVGFDAYVVHKLASEFKVSLGVVAYGLEAVRQGLRYSFPPFTCRVDGREFRASFAVVLRTSRYAGWLRLAPRANLFEPRFNLCLFKSGSWARYFLYAGAVLIRQHTKLSDVEIVEATRIDCAAPDSAKPVYVELDGEITTHLPVTFEIVHDALTLLVP